jgi:hypothetical protein
VGLTSAFPRRTRAIMPAVGQAQRFIEVATEDELRVALTPRDTTSSAALLANTGRRIVIVAPITLKAPIEIAASLPGTVIESHGKLPIFCGVDGIDAFVVSAVQCIIRDLLITSPDVTGNTSTISFSRAVVAKADGLRVLDVDTFGCDSLVVGDAGVDDVIVRGCKVLVTSGNNAPAVYVDGAGWRIMGNTLDGSGTGLAVEGGTSSERCAIVGNDLNGDGITTSAGSGLNTISANTNAGVVTAHGTDDALGGNT